MIRVQLVGMGLLCVELDSILKVQVLNEIDPGMVFHLD